MDRTRRTGSENHERLREHRGRCVCFGRQPGQAKAESVDVTFANATNATISVTAKDLNDGGKIIAKDEVLKHNEQVTEKWS